MQNSWLFKENLFTHLRPYFGYVIKLYKNIFYRIFLHQRDKTDDLNINNERNIFNLRITPNVFAFVVLFVKVFFKM